MSVTAAQGVPQLADLGVLPTHFADMFNVTYHNETILPRIAKTGFYKGVLTQGDEVEIANRITATTSAHQKGGQITHQKYNGTSTKIYVNRARDFSMPISKIDLKQTHLELVNMINEEAMAVMAEDVETEFFLDMKGEAHEDNRGSAAGAKSGSFDLGTSASPFEVKSTTVVEYITRLSAVMGEANAVKKGTFALVLPEVMRQKLMNSELRNAMVMGDPKSALRTGLLGQLDRAVIYTSNLLPGLGTVADPAYVFGFNTDAVNYVSQMNESRIIEDKDFWEKFIQALMVYDWGVVKPEGLVEGVIKIGSEA